MKGSAELKDEMAGCTAVTVLVKENRIWCGNAGDSRCIAGINGEAIALSNDHKPNDPSEMERIVNAGGFVEFNRVNGNLALSRALGDFIFKTEEELPQNKQIVSAEPEVQERTISEVFFLFQGILRCKTSSPKIRTTRLSLKRKCLQPGSKWSETRKKHETADPSAAAVADRRRRRRPISSVEYVNTSYHTTFHQNISINVACMHKRALVP